MTEVEKFIKKIQKSDAGKAITRIIPREEAEKALERKEDGKNENI